MFLLLSSIRNAIGVVCIGGRLLPITLICSEVLCSKLTGSSLIGNSLILITLIGIGLVGDSPISGGIRGKEVANKRK